MRITRVLSTATVGALLIAGIPAITAPAAQAGGGNVLLQETLTPSQTAFTPGRHTTVKLTVRNMDALRTQTGRYTITPQYPLQFKYTPSGCSKLGSSAVCSISVSRLGTATKYLYIEADKSTTKSGRFSITGANTAYISVDATVNQMQAELASKGSITSGFLGNTRLYSRSASVVTNESVKAMSKILDACDTGVPWKGGEASAGEIARFLGSRAADISTSYFRKLGNDWATKTGAYYLQALTQGGIFLNARYTTACNTAINFVQLGIGFTPTGSIINTAADMVLVAMNLSKAQYDSAVRSISSSGCLVAEYPAGMHAIPTWKRWDTWSKSGYTLTCK